VRIYSWKISPRAGDRTYFRLSLLAGDGTSNKDCDVVLLHISHDVVGCG
jgi:hypothetical protein